MFDDYAKTYYAFSSTLLQASFIEQISRILFKEFPSYMPDFIRDQIARDTDLIQRGMEEHNPETVTLSINFNEDSITILLLTLTTRLTQSGQYPQQVGYIDFERVICCQHLVMVFTYLEAFLGDTVAMICRVKPEVMKSKDRKIDWETVIDLKGYDRLLSILGEEFASNFFNNLTILESVELLQKRFGIKLGISKSELDLLDNARRARHAIVHNGGKADSKYLRETRRTDLSAGQSIPIDQSYLANVLEAVTKLAASLFTEISVKFFGADRAEIRI